MAGEPKTSFYVVLAAVVLGLASFGLFRAGFFGGDDPPAPVAPNAGGQGGNAQPRPGGDPGGGQGNKAPDNKDPVGPNGANPQDPAAGATGEQPSDVGITTVQEYTKLAPAAERLPPPKGASAYKPLADTDNTVNFAINVWAGWGPIILANDGFAAGKVWKTQDGQEFKLELILMDDPVKMRDAYSGGDVHIGWGTLDMLPLFMEGFVDERGKPVDTRVMPRVFQQIDWSNGGDGIVVRESIKTVADLRGKRLALARNSPSHYFALNMLKAGGVQPGELTLDFYGTAFEAAAAFNAERDIAGAVSWAPDIYNLADTRGNRMLVSTKTANKLIADIWFARADFANDNPAIIEALVRGIFDGMEGLKDAAQKQRCAQMMAQGYNMPATDTLGMFADAHNTNWAENYQFFMNQNNPANFERTWGQAYYLYRQVSSIRNPAVPFDQVMDFSVIEKLGKEDKYKKQRDEYRVQFAPEPAAKTRAEQDEVVTKTVVIHFYPNSWDLGKTITKEVDGQTVDELYDPNIKFVLQEIAAIASQFGAARIVIEGHTDASMRGQIPAAVVKGLSLNRANAVKEALVAEHGMDANQFGVDGIGWDRPGDPDDPENHAKNRRVEIRVYSAERAP